MGHLPEVAKSDGQFLAIHLCFAFGIALSHSLHHGHSSWCSCVFGPRSRSKHKISRRATAHTIFRFTSNQVTNKEVSSINYKSTLFNQAFNGEECLLGLPLDGLCPFQALRKNNSRYMDWSWPDRASSSRPGPEAGCCSYSLHQIAPIQHLERDGISLRWLPIY